MSTDPDMRGLDRLRERIAGLEQATAAVECSDDRMDAYLRGMRDAEALVAPDYDGDDGAAQQPDDEPETKPQHAARPAPELRGVIVPPPHLRAELPHLPVWTPERDDELVRRRAAGEDWPTIHAALTVLPGGVISSPEACAQRIYRLRAAGDARAIPLRPQGIDEEHWAEAIEMRRNRKGGREICEEFGWDLRRAGTICSALDRAIAEERAA